MWSRRELLSAGVAGSLVGESAAAAEEQPADREGQREIAQRLASVERAINGLNPTSLSQGVVGPIRANMTQFARAHQKFPDFIEVGMDVFYDLYDWHVKHRQQIVVVRQQDGRYVMQFMFSQVVLRPDQDPRFIGYPYDKG